jgi:PAT family beta-lactamase induction signal transducer AmpG
LVKARVSVPLLFLGFSSGLPFSLAAGNTLKVWLSRSGVDVKTLGLLSLLALPYSLKFLWAPLMDRFSPGFWGGRRGWIALLQLAL